MTGSIGVHMVWTGVIQKIGKWPAFLFGTLAIWIFYTLSNQLTFKAAKILQPGIVDGYTPFLSWSIWIYFPYYLIIALAWALEDDAGELSRFISGLLLINVISNLIFFICPSSVVRTPLAETCDWGLYACELFSVVYFFDTPANCIPSLHVALSTFVGMVWWNKPGFMRFVFLFWGALICLSTLTTGQHLFSDLVTGFAVSGNIWIYLYYIKAEKIT